MKYIYWMDAAPFDRVRAMAAENGLLMHEAKKAVCVPLSKKIDLGYVPPDAWEKYTLCKRQLSWYKTSPYFGQTLLVSSRNLASWGLVEDALIRDSKFRCRKFQTDPNSWPFWIAGAIRHQSRMRGIRLIMKRKGVMAAG